MSAQHDTDLLTLREAAALLKLTPVTIKRWLKQGRLPAYRVGPRAIRIKHEDLQTILQPAGARKVAMKPEPELFAPPTEAELARRQALVVKIRANREEWKIAPLTAVELVHRSREERDTYDERS